MIFLFGELMGKIVLWCNLRMFGKGICIVLCVVFV